MTNYMLSVKHMILLFSRKRGWPRMNCPCCLTRCDFIGNGVSSIDDKFKLNSGRPHGGIGIMWRKHMNKHCTFKTYNCNRIAGLEINCGSFKALFLCVYMPCDSSENYDDFMFYLNKLLQIADEFPSPHFFICGDFKTNAIIFSYNSLLLVQTSSNVC